MSKARLIHWLKEVGFMLFLLLLGFMQFGGLIWAKVGIIWTALNAIVIWGIILGAVTLNIIGFIRYRLRKRKELS